jgi:hypothetical protein
MGNPTVPVLDHVISAAKKVVAGGIVRKSLKLIAQNVDGFINLTGRKQFLRSCRGADLASEKEHQWTDES